MSRLIRARTMVYDYMWSDHLFHLVRPIHTTWSDQLIPSGQTSSYHLVSPIHTITTTATSTCSSRERPLSSGHHYQKIKPLAGDLAIIPAHTSVVNIWLFWHDLIISWFNHHNDTPTSLLFEVIKADTRQRSIFLPVDESNLVSEGSPNPGSPWKSGHLTT